VSEDRTTSAVFRSYPLPELRPGEFYVEPIDPASVGAPIYCVENDPFDYFAFHVKSLLYTGQTAVQKVVIAESYNYGRILFLDGFVQSAAEDEALYHEMLVQPAMLLHPNPHDVLIIGGGEGATLREVLAHRTVRSATMVDIDREVVELCREFLPTWHRGAFEDPRARLIFADGRAFVEGSDDLFDVVIIDVVDMLENGPALALYTRQFYEILRKRLRPGGIVMVQGLEFSFSDYKQHVALSRTLRAVFAEVHSMRVAVPSFLGSWGIIMASDWVTPKNFRPETIDLMIEQRLGNYWIDHLSGEFLLASFTHCKETRYLLSQSGPVLEDGVPFVEPPDVEEIEPARTALPALDRT
jgi:spermidine synthase